MLAFISENLGSIIIGAIILAIIVLILVKMVRDGNKSFCSCSDCSSCGSCGACSLSKDGKTNNIKIKKADTKHSDQ